MRVSVTLPDIQVFPLLSSLSLHFQRHSPFKWHFFSVGPCLQLIFFFAILLEKVIKKCTEEKCTFSIEKKNNLGYILIVIES